MVRQSGRRTWNAAGRQNEQTMTLSTVVNATVPSRLLPHVRGPNNLPSDVTSAESLSTFRQRLKTHLFSGRHFRDIWLDFSFLPDLPGH